MRWGTSILIWSILAIACAVPLAAAAMSPLLAWRQPVYIAAGFAGIVGMALLLVQPLLAGGVLPGLPPQRGRRVHRAVGWGLVAAVVIHVVGLWFTSPPDVIDALLFRSPTLFSVWGVIAMWAVFAAAALVAFRRRLRLHPRIWLRAHTTLVVVTVVGSVVHALLIEGTMETKSKVALCVLVLAATTKVVRDRKVWKTGLPPRPKTLGPDRRSGA
ncbi:ferric reductase-like transmembrane domain-containing protein [Tropicimonas marinistellae]|uniref:ferric reductase-like transmembrane domain-containing protein n=1 Tax=Tropicimonas marinistellae TaxID=1739787 RepID=UPI000832E8EF|nr:ferric reductase-like transmembrane domain-containing protein [Tropicimonas marinistellae]